MFNVVEHLGFFSVEAPAKINVGLRVLGKRPDGYHDLESLVMAVNLTDRLEARTLPLHQLSLEVKSEDGETPADESNLVLRAARLLWEEIDAEPGAALRLVKRIPVGRGLGGGSSDAAAALVLLNRIWEVGLSHEALSDLAATLGSDVPFFLKSPLAIMKGRGEIIEPLNFEVRVGICLVIPPFGLPTKDVYGRLQPPLTASGGQAILWAGLLRDGQLEALGRQLVNDLEIPAQALRPELAQLRTALEKLRVPCVSMSGSGSALYLLAAGEREIRRIIRDLHVGDGVRVYALSPWNQGVALPSGKEVQPWK
jgi:4-diphosphocytidyl-2-C-methyl-D-erythritol kinase